MKRLIGLAVAVLWLVAGVGLMAEAEEPLEPATVMVTLEPEAARNAGAQWELRLGDWRSGWKNSGDTVSVRITMTTGYYIFYRVLQGWRPTRATHIVLKPGEFRHVRFVYEPEEDAPVRIGASYTLGHEFPAKAQRVGPLLITFKLEEAPPGSYINRVVSVTPGWVFHTPVDFPPRESAPTVWEYGFAGLDWYEVIRALAGTPVLIKATVEVVVSGPEPELRTVDVEFDVRIDAIASVYVMSAHSVYPPHLHPRGTTRNDHPQNPLPLRQWIAVKPGQVLRVYSRSQIMMRCISGVAWLLQARGIDDGFVDITLGSHIIDLSMFPLPRDTSYVELALDWGADQVKDEARDRLVTRAVGKTAGAFFGKVMMVFGIIGIGDEAPLGGNDVFAVRLRSEVSLDFRADGAVTARTFEGTPDVIGADGSTVALPAGYETTRHLGTGTFSTPVRHNYRSPDDLPPLPDDPPDPDPDPPPPDDGKSHTYGSATGWYLVSFPIEAGVPSGVTMWRWNPSAAAYERPSSLQPTQGSWAYLQANTRFSYTTGGPPASDVTMNLGAAGWHMVSAPWSYPRSAIRVTRGTETKTWAEAVAAGWIRNAIYGFRATDGAYTMPATLHPWYGHWLDARVAGLTLRFVHAMRSASLPDDTGIVSLAVEPLDLPPMPVQYEPTVVLAVGSFPNPVVGMGGTTFRVLGPQAAEASELQVTVRDLSGRMVWQGSAAGAELVWHTEDLAGRPVANGMYLYEVRAYIAGEWVTAQLQRLAIIR